MPLYISWQRYSPKFSRPFSNILYPLRQRFPPAHAVAQRPYTHSNTQDGHKNARAGPSASAIIIPKSLLVIVSV